MLRIGKMYRMPVYTEKKDRHGKTKETRLGRIHMTVFSPSGKRVVGFTISRPDIAGMVKRPDVFIAYDSFTVVDEKGIVPTQGDESFDNKARERLHIDWDHCLICTGMDAKTTDGKELGYIDDAEYDPETGKVSKFFVGDDSLSRKLVGAIEIPVSMLKGYHKGYMVVAPEAAHLGLDGGLAAKAGENYAKAKIKGKEAGKKTQKAMDKGAYKLGHRILETKQAMEESKKEFDEVSGKPAKKKATEQKDVSAQAARAVGKQIGKMGSMFESFKKEYKKASR
ncbi:PRC-barrel domain containing protein [Atopobium sp. oral taxon 416]|uniref:PRC-barrel domain containing protein n=1 Tax=Atopobium sp. oral taxon 416 TaxID=712157 RepID=UPI001BAA70C1|nr:PRC-barrel domain containing protein [Atopobium sp. oral taxon 416]QUC03330.1 PRC-barrel domain containing protein [Atopobium sp. oral taxon 416]